jgi:hypothetical protein
MFIIGFAVCYCIACVIALIDEDWIVEWLVKPFCAVALVIVFIPCFFWHVFRYLFNGVTEKTLQGVLDLPHYNFGPIYVFYDKEAKHIWNKIFFVRVLTNR